MKINIMGFTWTIVDRSESEDPGLKDCDGYTDRTIREIVIERETAGTLNDMEVYIKKVKRHEIVHAFLLECGLHECSGDTEAWTPNETMVDWFVRIGPRIYAAWKEAEAL